MGAEPPSLPDETHGPVPRRPGEQAGPNAVIATLANLCGVLIQLGYPALYALLVTLALGVGGALIFQITTKGSGAAGGGPSTPE